MCQYNHTQYNIILYSTIEQCMHLMEKKIGNIEFGG